MNKSRVLWTEAFKEEIAVVRARRDGLEDVDKNLVGLAISGGGIRSATFALGVLEGLKIFDLLAKIDYLSTVSGGGYIGAWLSANCKRAADKKQISWLHPDADWKLSVDHLRRYSNYLSPTLGFFSADTWSMGAIWIRNTLLVQFTVILAIACALLIPRPLYGVFRHWPEVGNWRWTTILLFVLGAVGIAGNHLRLGRRMGVWVLKGKHWLIGAFAAAFALVAAWLIGTLTHFEPFSNQQISVVPSFAIALLLIVAGFFLQPVGVKIINKAWRGPDPPQQINYTQAWVQGLVVIPMLAIGFLVGAILWGQSQSGAGQLSTLTTYGEFFATAWRYWPFPLAVVFVSLWLFAICSIRNFKNVKCWAAALLAPFPAIVVLHAQLCGIMLLLHGWAVKGNHASWPAFVWAPPLVLYAFSITIVILIGMLGRQSSEGVREWWSRFGAWLGIYGFGWMLINVAAAYGPWLSAGLLMVSSLGISLSGGWIATTVAGLMAGNSDATGKSAESGTKTIVLDVIAKIAPFVFIAGLLILVSTALHLVIVSNLNFTWQTPRQLQDAHWSLMESANLGFVGALLGGCFITLLILAARVDINEFSLNAFYRSRLVRCYLGATRYHARERHPQNFTGFDDDDDLPLASLGETHHQAGTPGPFLIINCALNLGGSKDLALHTRHSAIFTLTPLRCGSRYESRDQRNTTVEIGYSTTSTFGGKDGQPSLGQAISVSGAAASPNMGYHTSPVVAFLMTLFNVRLGWWFPNPFPKADKSPSPWFSLRYLFMELFGGANDKSSYVAISDGGHFENMAAYELVKRQCRVIIISDAECDPDYQFEGLGTLIRVCNVDFGTRIAIDVNAIRPGESHWSDRRCAVGTIEYPDGSRGTLIYLKASMTGEEASDILQYKAGHATFPHESTGNQFYAEDQFESYRNLGRDIVMRAFESVHKDGNVAMMGDKLEQIYSPALHNAAQFTRHGQHLMDLWSKLSDNPDLTFLDRELTDSWPHVPRSDSRAAFYLCCEILQLMENVYMDLRLEDTWEHPDNSGWRSTFQQWSSSPVIQKTWQLTSTGYGLRFRYFCQRRLGLALSTKAAGE